MSQINIDLVREQFSKAAFSKVVDTKITKLVTTEVTTVEPTTENIQLFFQAYDTLFTAIPKFGATNSHEYLVQQSGNYIDANNQQEEIALLLEEINSLRNELLESNRTNLELESKLTNG
jgi:hypothetical protein